MDCLDENDIPGWGSAGLDIGIMVGMIVSFLPQYYNFIKNRSSVGISYIQVFLGNCASCFVFLLAVFARWQYFQCLPQLGFEKMTLYLMSTYELLVPTFNYLLIYILVLVFYPSPGDDEKKRKDRQNAFISIGVFLLLLLFVIGTGVLVVSVFGPTSRQSKSFQVVLEILTIAVTISQWIPQIIITFKMKTAGELSVIMVMIQSVGSLLIAISEAISNFAAWTVWLPYIISCIEMVVLIIIIIVFDGFFCLCKRKLPSHKIVAGNINVAEDDAENLLLDSSKDDEDDIWSVGDDKITMSDY